MTKARTSALVPRQIDLGGLISRSLAHQSRLPQQQLQLHQQQPLPRLALQHPLLRQLSKTYNIIPDEKPGPRDQAFLNPQFSLSCRRGARENQCLTIDLPYSSQMMIQPLQIALHRFSSAQAFMCWLSLMV